MTNQVESAGDFNWEEAIGTDNGFGAEYSDTQKEEMLALYGETIGQLNEREVIQGIVVSVTDREVVVNIGFKSDGLVARNEFRDLDELKPGDEVEVYVEKQEDANGQLILSRRKAKIVKAWEQIQSAFDNDTVIEGVVKRRTSTTVFVFRVVLFASVVF